MIATTEPVGTFRFSGLPHQLVILLEAASFLSGPRFCFPSDRDVPAAFLPDTRVSVYEPFGKPSSLSVKYTQQAERFARLRAVAAARGLYLYQNSVPSRRFVVDVSPYAKYPRQGSNL